MLRAFASVGLLTLLSRVSGFIRDVLTARYLGAGPFADAFFVAFRLPNLFRTLFAEGAFQAAFVPSLTNLLIDEDKSAARRFAGAALSLLTLASLAVSLVLIAFPQTATNVLAPGILDDGVRGPLAVSYLRLTGLYLVFMSIAAFYGALAQVHNKFAAAAAAPILLNIFLSLALVFFATRLDDPGVALAIAAPLSGIAQVAVVAWSAKSCGESILPGPLQWSQPLRNFLKHLGPAILGSGVVQISAFADTIIVSYLPAGQIAYLYYADRLYQLPFGVIGIALSTVVLPTLSRAFAQNDDKMAHWAFGRAVELALVLSLPVTALMAVGAPFAVSGVFGYGAFTPGDVANTAAIVAAYALGLPAGILVRCLAPTFQAKGDTATPTRIAALVLVVSVTLKILLAERIGAAGIASATAAAAWLNFLFLSRAARRDKLVALDPQIQSILWRTLAGAGLAALTFWTILHAADAGSLFAGRGPEKILWLAFPGIIAILVYAVFLWASRYRRHSLVLARRSQEKE